MASNNSVVYQFKISLKHITPKIWRRIQVPADYSFLDFHLSIQDAMGWQDCHLHEFAVKNPMTGKKDNIGTVDRFDDDSEEEEDDFLMFALEKRVCNREAKIARYFSAPKDKAVYIYDMGDGWIHDIVLEKILPAEADVVYPLCLAGKRACPPEDCGGDSGYEHLLEIISDPNHKEYAERMEWLEETTGGEFDPEKFDPKSVSFASILFPDRF